EIPQPTRQSQIVNTPQFPEVPNETPTRPALRVPERAAEPARSTQAPIPVESPGIGRQKPAYNISGEISNEQTRDLPIGPDVGQRLADRVESEGNQRQEASAEIGQSAFDELKAKLYEQGALEGG